MYKIKQSTRRAITIVEIMVVVTLIGVITAALAWNVSGYLEEGRRFRTKTNIERVQSFLEIEIAKRPDRANEIINSWQDVVRQAPQFKKPEEVMIDGWGDGLEVSLSTERGYAEVIVKTPNQDRMGNFD